VSVCEYVCFSVCMGWLRIVGSLKLQVSIGEYSLFYRALLQKRPVILRSLLIVATPYVYWSVGVFVSLALNPRSTLRVCNAGWRRRRGCLISCITFRKLATDNRALLRKMKYKRYGTCESLPPCTCHQEIHSSLSVGLSVCLQVSP